MLLGGELRLGSAQADPGGATERLDLLGVPQMLPPSMLPTSKTGNPLRKRRRHGSNHPQLTPGSHHTGQIPDEPEQRSNDIPPGGIDPEVPLNVDVRITVSHRQPPDRHRPPQDFRPYTADPNTTITARGRRIAYRLYARSGEGPADTHPNRSAAIRD